MRKQLLTLIALVVLPQPALAWGHEGHAIIGDIAEARMTPEALAAARQLLALDGATHLAEVASWADEMKAEHMEGGPAHSIRLPLDHSTGQAAIDAACEGHYCVVKAIGDYLAVLRDKNAPAARREIALKFVIHLVGDVHQPLHCSYYTGKTPVVFGDGPATIHQVWDSGIIQSHGRDAAATARQLLGSEAAVDTGGDPASWAFESRDIARDRIFTLVPTTSDKPVALPAHYAEDSWPIVAERLTQAGLRLAKMLDDSL